jgi:hypothetical protein
LKKTFLADERNYSGPLMRACTFFSAGCGVELPLRAICACFDNLTIQIGISTSGIAPRYIDGHTFFLNASPNRLVVEQGSRSPDCASEIFDRDRPKLDSCCFAAGNSRIVGVNNGIG